MENLLPDSSKRTSAELKKASARYNCSGVLALAIALALALAALADLFELKSEFLGSPSVLG